jgi:hypothetical protein
MAIALISSDTPFTESKPSTYPIATFPSRPLELLEPLDLSNLSSLSNFSSLSNLSTSSAMTDAKSALESTIRDLRETLLADLHDAVESRYRMSVDARRADLPPRRARDRERLEARIDERVRARPEAKKDEESRDEAFDRMRREIEKEAAYTFLNRLVVLRLMEEADLSTPAVLDGGWDSPGYREFREWAPALCDDATEGYRTLLELVFDELARDLPGLFGESGAAELVPVPPDTLRETVEVLNDEALDPVWSDDTTLGWVYQYWNDPEREALDDKINNRNKIEPHEIASKTQLFTERYMVEWLLQNSLGSKWLAICQKNGWTPECGVEANRQNAKDAKKKTTETRSTRRKGHGEGNEGDGGDAPKDGGEPSDRPASVEIGEERANRQDAKDAKKKTTETRRTQREKHGEDTNVSSSGSSVDSSSVSSVSSVVQLWKDGLPGSGEDDDREAEVIRDEAIERIRANGGPQSVLQRLAVRRAEWRQKRESGEVDAEQPMPIAGDETRRSRRGSGAEAEDAATTGSASDTAENWKYWVPREMPDNAPEQAPDSIRDLELLDPACGSGHFLVIAFDLLVDFYREEARHRGESWSDREIVESILENNLHGLEIDPRCTQIAAAALYLKAQTTCEDAEPSQINLVAPQLDVANLPDDDPALVEFREAVEAETDLSGELVDAILDALAEAHHLGSLLKVGEAVEEAIRADFGWGDDSPLAQARQLDADVERAKSVILDELEEFLSHHTGAEDLGLRLRGEQLANGVRFLQLNREDRYDVVAANPPYQGASKMEDTSYLDAHYEEGKRDLYSAFLMRGPQLARPGGASTMVTMRNWMFIKSFVDLRDHLTEAHGLELLADLDTNAFEEIGGEVVGAVMTLLRADATCDDQLALRPAPLDGAENQTLPAKRATLLDQVRRYTFDVEQLKGIEGRPLIYWWNSNLLEKYINSSKIGEVSPAKKGLCTGNNRRFQRKPWELNAKSILFSNGRPPKLTSQNPWAPTIEGAKGQQWLEPLRRVVLWGCCGLELNQFQDVSSGIRIQNSGYYFEKGVSFAMIGSRFSGRAHRHTSIFGDAGSSIFPNNINNITCLFNSSLSKYILKSLNPSVNFQVGDVNRLPLFEIDSADEIFARIEEAFAEHEAHREASVEFREPGESCWEWAQDWAQRAVDRDDGEPLPDWDPEYDDPDPASFVSFAVGVAMGRFGADGEGVLSWEGGQPVPAGPHVVEEDDKMTRGQDAEKSGGREARSSAESPDSASQPLDLSTSSDHPTFHTLPGDPVVAEPVDQTTLPSGILYVSEPEGDDSLDHPACERLHDAWAEHGDDVGRKKDDLNSYLREKYFKDWVKGEYDKRPIYLPLTSPDKSFVAHVSIHRWDADTLRTLLADHLKPERKRLEGRLEDMRATRASSDGGSSIEDRIVEHEDWLDELDRFIELIEQCAEKGAPKYEEDEPDRERDARYDPVLDDGVMINSAALWPLLEPVWKKPRDWWNRLATEYGYRNKHFDWSRLAARYWPTRVYDKCADDPSLGVAHDCFWFYHPEKAYEWELRLKFDMDDPNFVLEESFPELVLDESTDAPTCPDSLLADGEPPADAAEARARFLAHCPDAVAEIREDERSRREREADKNNHRPDWVVDVPEPEKHV